MITPKFLKIPPMTVTRVSYEKSGSTKFRRAVKLSESLVYRSKFCESVAIVPADFVSDGASVPQLFWNLLPPFGEYLPAAVVHDLFCALGRAGQSPVDSKTAALIFREAMQVLGVGKVKRNIMFRAVLHFGPRFKAKPC